MHAIELRCHGLPFARRLARAVRPLAMVVPLLLVPAHLHAQLVQGRVTDESGLRPILAVEVKLFTDDGHMAAVAVSDSLGSYELRVPEPGVYWVQADRIGYRALRSPLLALPSGKTVTADFELPTDPIELEGLRVEVEAMAQIRRELRTFGVRADELGERFVEPDRIAQRPTARDFGSVLQWQSIPAMQVVRSDDHSDPPGPPWVCVRLVPGRPTCAKTVVNGAPVTLEVAYHVPPQTLRAMAVLRPDEATLLYGTDGVGGAVLMFTR